MVQTGGTPAGRVRVSTNKSKKVVRYHPPEVLAAAAALERTRERHVAACGDAWRGFLREDAAGKFLELRAAVRAAAGLDALNSLAALARSEGYCRPTLLPNDGGDEKTDDDDANTGGGGGGDCGGGGGDRKPTPPTLRIVDGRHPILDATLAGGQSFVPNSVHLCSEGTRALVGVVYATPTHPHPQPPKRELLSSAPLQD